MGVLYTVMRFTTLAEKAHEDENSGAYECINKHMRNIYSDYQKGKSGIPFYCRGCGREIIQVPNLFQRAASLLLSSGTLSPPQFYDST